MNQTLSIERDWQQIRPCHRQCKPKIKKRKVKIKLPILGKAICLLIAECGRQITTTVYVVAEEVLSIIQITPERQILVRQLTEMIKASADAEAIISGSQRQGEINNNMEKIINNYKTLFQGLGRTKVESINIESDRTVKPINQKQRPIAVQDKTLFRKHIEELEKERAVSPALYSSQ